MTERRPINQQIEAVVLALVKTDAIAKASAMRAPEREELRIRLGAAAETLRTLEYGAEIAR